MSDILPPEDLVLGKHVPVMDAFLMGSTHLLIDIVGNQHVHFLPLFLELLQGIKDLVQRLLVHPVVAVHHLEIFPGCVGKSVVHRVSVPPVLLIHHPDNIRIFLLIFMGDPGSIIL